MSKPVKYVLAAIAVLLLINEVRQFHTSGTGQLIRSAEYHVQPPTRETGDPVFRSIQLTTFLSISN